MLSDLPHIYLFWMVFFIIGIINLPLTFIIFKKFIDKGYIFSKILGLVIVSYIVWLLSILKVFPFTTNSILVSALGLFVFNILLFIKLRKSSFQVTLSDIKLFAFEELIFATGLTFWSYVRGFNPEIRGLEKFMDFGFINSILKTKYMPPLDMWLAASPDYPYHTINYYYFGHYVTALLTKISTVAPEIAYNIMLGVLFAFTFTCSFSIAANLFAHLQKQNRRNILCGLLAGFLVAMGGNLHTIYAFTKGYALDKPQPPWEVMGSPNFNSYWYPNATRFIANTIHEFPIYSFVVSDLHGHVLDIPFVLLTIAFLFSILISVKSDNAQKFKNQNAKVKNTIQNSKFFIFNFSFLILLGLLLAVMYMTNAWDGLIYLALSGMVLFILNTSLNSRKAVQQGIKNLELRIKNQKINFTLLNFVFSFSILLFSFFLFSLPFNKTFVPFAKGIGVNCVTPNASNQVLCDHSPWWMLLILWGYFYFFAISFLLLAKKLKTSDVFAVLLILISTALLIAPEFIFARDIYPAHYRANTMFKLGYQAFMMLGIVVSYVFFRLEKKPLWRILAYLQLFLVLIYPVFAINSYYNGLKLYQGLDGLSWLWKMYPGDRAAVEFFREELNEFEQPVVLEGVGESYTDYSRLSANTGLPTVLGWPVHEWLWRGSYDEPGKRVEEVRRIYEASSIEEARNLLTKYNVKYVIVGSLEQQKYPKMNEQNLFALGKIVFEKGSTRIYKLNP